MCSSHIYNFKLYSWVFIVPGTLGMQIEEILRIVQGILGCAVQCGGSCGLGPLWKKLFPLGATGFWPSHFWAFIFSSPLLLMPSVSSQWKGKALQMEELFPKGLNELILTATFLSSKSEARAGGLSLQSRGDSDIIVTSWHFVLDRAGGIGVVCLEKHPKKGMPYWKMEYLAVKFHTPVCRAP